MERKKNKKKFSINLLIFCLSRKLFFFLLQTKSKVLNANYLFLSLLLQSSFSSYMYFLILHIKDYVHLILSSKTLYELLIHLIFIYFISLLGLNYCHSRSKKKDFLDSVNCDYSVLESSLSMNDPSTFMQIDVSSEFNYWTN